MQIVLRYIEDWFLEKKDYFKVFAEADTRLEGWFKAELILLLNDLLKHKVIDEFKREWNVSTPAGRKQIDFCLYIRGELHYCELKAMCISQAAGTPRNLQFYFRDDNVGLIKDFKKLDAISGDNKWILGFVYPRPEALRWASTLESLPSDFRHWRCITKPEDFPDYIFICLWKSEVL